MNAKEKLHLAAVLTLGLLAIVSSVAGWPTATAILAASMCWLAWRGRELDAEPATVIECEFAEGE